MSYDITFKVQLAHLDRFVPVGDCDANITWNVRDIIKLSTGLEWKNEDNNGLVKDVIPKILKGRTELLTHPNKYKKYEASNGWGTVEGTIRFFDRIIEAWTILCYEDPDLADIAVFWIE